MPVTCCSCARPRDLATLVPGQCRYSPLVDADGGMLNDPVVLQVGDDRYRVSIADADAGLWMSGLAHGPGLDARVHEADVHPLAVQGPKAETLLARVFGEAVRDIGFFGYRRLAFGRHPLAVARSGFSKQGGFEIYVEGAALAEPLWDALMAAGADLEVRAGGPSLIERIEGGLLSYGNDMTRADTPYQCGLGALCRLDTDPPCVGAAALAGEAADGPPRAIRGLRIEGGAVPLCRAAWPVHAGGAPVGRVSSAVWSPDCGTNVAIGMIDAAHWAPGTAVEVECPDGVRGAVVCRLPHL